MHILWYLITRKQRDPPKKSGHVSIMFALLQLNISGNLNQSMTQSRSTLKSRKRTAISGT